MRKSNTLKKVELEQQEFWNSTRVSSPHQSKKKYKRKQKYKPDYEQGRN